MGLIINGISFLNSVFITTDTVMPTFNFEKGLFKLEEFLIFKIKKSASLNYPFSKLKVGMTVSVVVNTEFKKDIPFIISPIANLFYKFHTL